VICDFITRVRKFNQSTAIAIFGRMRRPRVAFAPKADLRLKGPCSHDEALLQAPAASKNPERPRPTKEEVRRWLQRVIETRMPPPPIADIRRDLWCPERDNDDEGRHDCP
jgi:hypothetical protein